MDTKACKFTRIIESEERKFCIRGVDITALQEGENETTRILIVGSSESVYVLGTITEVRNKLGWSTEEEPIDTAKKETTSEQAEMKIWSNDAQYLRKFADVEFRWKHLPTAISFYRIADRLEMLEKQTQNKGSAFDEQTEEQVERLRDNMWNNALDEALDALDESSCQSFTAERIKKLKK